MNNQKLKRYLKTVYKMESSLFMMDELYTQMENESKSLRSYRGNPQFYNYEPEPTKSDVNGYYYKGFGFLIGLLSPILLSVIISPLFQKKNSYSSIFSIFNLEIGFLIGIIILSLIGGIVGIIIGSTITNKKYSEKLKEWEQSKIQTDAVNSSIINQNQNQIAVYQQQADILDEQINHLGEKYNETLDILKTYYDLNIIFPKYQNLVAISSIYEYLLSGRCHQLEGHGGAYDTYEYESRLDKIITQLDDVIERLDEIKENQYQLYIAVENGFSQSNSLLNNINNGINKLETSQKLSNYYDKITAQNTEYFKMVHLFGQI